MMPIIAPAFEVIVCGSLHLDVMVQTSALPRLDETVVGSAWDMQCGGKGGNQAVMAATMGARTAMIGRVGDDDFGKRLTANLKFVGIEHSAVGADAKAGSGMSVALLEPGGEYGAVIVSGANLALDADVCVAQWHRLGGAKVLVLQNEIPDAVNVAIAQVARAAGALVVLNAAPARAMPGALLDAVDVLVVNRIEAEILTGLAVTDETGAARAAVALAKRAQNVVLTLGADGLVHVLKGAAPKAIAPISVKMVSSHGAGDCFVGALAYRLAAGDDLEMACQYANQSAARFVSAYKQ